MNTKITTLALAMGAALFGCADASAQFDETRISAEAQWVAHLDMEALVETGIGQFALERLKDEMERSNDSKITVDVDRVIAEIKSITAYGTDLQDEPDKNSVLMIEAGDKLQLIVDGFIANMEATAEGEDEVPVELLAGKPFPTYLVGGELYFGYPTKTLLIASKDFGQLERAYAVYAGNAPGMARAQRSIVLNRDPGFFFLASAVGFGQLDVPHQARILQKTTGGQISLGQHDGEFRANLVLATAGAEVSDQLFRILQGMIALASFVEVEDEGLAELTQRMRVSQSERAVTIDLRYPADQILQLVQAAAEEHHHDRDGHDGHNDHNGESGEPAADAAD